MATLATGTPGAVLVTVGLVLASCSTGSSPGTATTTPSSTARARLLAVDDLGAGWTLNQVKVTSDGIRPCSDPPTATTLVGPQGAGVRFQQPGGFPELLEYLDDSSASPTSYADAIRRLETPSSCAKSVDGRPETSTFEEVIPAPHYGTHSVAMLVDIDDLGSSEQVGYEVVDTGSSVLVVGYGNAGPLDTAALERFTQQAIARLGT